MTSKIIPAATKNKLTYPGFGRLQPRQRLCQSCLSAPQSLQGFTGLITGLYAISFMLASPLLIGRSQRQQLLP